MIRSATVMPNEAPQRVEVRSHVLAADLDASDSAPSPHDYFDTGARDLQVAHRRTGTRSATGSRSSAWRPRSSATYTQERAGVYKLRVKVFVFFGALDGCPARGAVSRGRRVPDLEADDDVDGGDRASRGLMLEPIRVLVVEDDLEVAAAIARRLEGGGCRR